MRMESYEPDDISHGDKAIVLFNHVGSTVAQDTGRDADQLSSTLGIPVIAVNRPGTGGYLPNFDVRARLSSTEGYLTELSRIGAELDASLDRLGVTETYISGRSAGGLGALALAATESISTYAGVYAAEPVGTEHREVQAGKRHYRDYDKLQKNLMTSGLVHKPENKPDVTGFKALGRLASIGWSFAYDTFHSQQIWASDAAWLYARSALDTGTGSRLAIDFAEHSLVLSSADTLHAYKKLALEHTNMQVDILPGTSHASFDDRQLFASRLSLTMQLD